eukprot:g12943.t1
MTVLAAAVVVRCLIQIQSPQTRRQSEHVLVHFPFRVEVGDGASARPPPPQRLTLVLVEQIVRNRIFFPGWRLDEVLFWIYCVCLSTRPVIGRLRCFRLLPYFAFGSSLIFTLLLRVKIMKVLKIINPPSR